MEADRELDARIAEILGDKLCHHELHETNPVCKHCHLNYNHWKPKWGRIIPPEFYSLDMKAAMNAAERTGLFLKYSLEQRSRDIWDIRDRRGYLFLQARTPALAICFAILEERGISKGMPI